MSDTPKPPPKTDLSDRVLGKGKSDDESLINFPAEIAVKAMGLASDDFAVHVEALVSPHLDDGTKPVVRTLNSRTGKYVSVSVVFEAQNHEQLKAIYHSLHEDPRVLFTL